jgi:hypothetical protein
MVVASWVMWCRGGHPAFVVNDAGVIRLARHAFAEMGEPCPFSGLVLGWNEPGAGRRGERG